MLSATIETRTFGIGTQDVTAIDAWIEQVAAKWSANERSVFRARLCIAELAANALEHGDPKPGDRIVVTLCNVGDGVEIEFLDTLKPFDPTKEPSTTKTQPSEAGGLGLKLVHAYAEELSYSNDGRYNRLKFKIKTS
jgi:serine/threonine-protein kinase RsbW